MTTPWSSSDLERFEQELPGILGLSDELCAESCISHFASEEYRKAIKLLLSSMPRDPRFEDAFFSRHPQPPMELPFEVIEFWEMILNTVHLADPARYGSMHKGTPFYFLAMASFVVGDFERALFYLDSAIDEDCRTHGPGWHRLPAGLFILMDDADPAQAGILQARWMLQAFQNAARIVERAGGSAVSLEKYRQALVRQAIDQQPELRSVVTAILSFVLEYPNRKSMLDLATAGAATGEAFLLHLLKGAVIFETLLAQSPQGIEIATARGAKRLTLGDLLSDSRLFAPLGFKKTPQGQGSLAFEDVLPRVAEMKSQARMFPEVAALTAWGLRSVTGHRLTWRHHPSSVEYEMLFAYVHGAINLAISALF